MTTMDKARAAKATLQEQLKNSPSVAGLGITFADDDWCVVVLTDMNVDVEVPPEVDGVPVIKRGMGPISALPRK